jgi:hypothetical protein
MRSIGSLFILLAFFEVTTAQRICPLDGNMGLLYLSKGSEVSIKTKHVGANMGGIYMFKDVGGVIKGKSKDLGDGDFDGDYDELFYYHYPEFIKIRNNDFLLSNKENDSLVLDSKGRAIEVYRKAGNQLSNAIRLKYHYLNDTTVLETVAIPHAADSSSETLYELDSKFNLKAIKEGDNITRFNYDKTCTRIINIEMLATDAMNKMVLQSTHTFIYRNNKPIKSFVYDVKKKAVVYEQVYSYK